MKIGSLVIEDTETAVEVTGDAWLNGEVTLVATLAPKTFNVTVKGYSGNTLGTFVATYGQEFNLMPYMPSNDSVVIPEIGQKYFDGFRIEGLEVKFVVGTLENLVWNYDFESEDVVLVATYESDDIWI